MNIIYSLLGKNVAFFVIPDKFHANWLKNKKAMVIQNLDFEILSKHFVQTWNGNISAGVVHWILANRIICNNAQLMSKQKKNDDLHGAMLCEYVNLIFIYS